MRSMIIYGHILAKTNKIKQQKMHRISKNTAINSPQYIGHEKHNNQLKHIRVRAQWVEYLCDIVCCQISIADEKFGGKWFGRTQLAEKSENAQQQRHLQPIRNHFDYIQFAVRTRFWKIRKTSDTLMRQEMRRKTKKKSRE